MMLLRILGAWFKLTINRNLSLKDALQRTGCERILSNRAHEGLVWSGALRRMGYHRLPKRVMSGELENVGREGRRKKTGLENGVHRQK